MRHNTFVANLPWPQAPAFHRPDAPESWWARPDLSRGEFAALLEAQRPRIEKSWFHQRMEPQILEAPPVKRISLPYL